ncbi:MAG TPA: PAS domain-containing sensor histidine kinase [Jatrophihabitans sp.]|nr:PAS domain-containing sensor histidine kinase [Jatrophihabitans sp.]
MHVATSRAEPTAALPRAAPARLPARLGPVALGPLALAGCGIACAALVLLLPPVLTGTTGFPLGSLRGAAVFAAAAAAIGLALGQLQAVLRRKTLLAEGNAELWNAVLAGTSVGIALVEGELSGATRFQVVNRALCATLGRAEDELRRLALSELVHRDDLPMLLRHAAHSRGGTIEVRLLARSQRVVWAEVSSARLTATGGPARSVWQIHDITAARAADSELLQVLESERAAADTLRSLDRQHRELLSAISHDLRTPVTAALGYAELLAEGDFGPLTEAQQKTMDIVARSLTNLSRIISELTVIAPELTREPMPVATLSVDAVIEDAVQMVALQAAMRNQAIVRHRHADTELLITGDEVRLGRAVVNLLTNAVKFTPEGGTVEVAVRHEGNEVAISIADDGDGIPIEDQHRIFDRFYRAPRATEDGQISGSGLGLAIVKAIAVQHGGSIELSSAPGDGATFTLRLPLLERMPSTRRADALRLG